MFVSSGSGYARLPLGVNEYMIYVYVCEWCLVPRVPGIGSDPLWSWPGKTVSKDEWMTKMNCIHPPFIIICHLLFFNFSFYFIFSLLYWLQHMFSHVFIQKLFIRGSEALKVLGDPPYSTLFFVFQFLTHTQRHLHTKVVPYPGPGVHFTAFIHHLDSRKGPVVGLVGSRMLVS